MSTPTDALIRQTAERLGLTPERVIQAYVGDHRAVGDLMQSSLSRLSEWVKKQESVPYEVRMAALEGKSAVEDWTNVRRKDNR